MGKRVQIAVFYVGASLPGPLRAAENAINSKGQVEVRVATHNCGGPLEDSQWEQIASDIEYADIVFVIHVTDNENASRLCALLDRRDFRDGTVISFNCMPELMRRTR